MRALITGGSGMLGSRIARLLAREGCRVRLSYRPGDSTEAIDDLPDLEHRPADLLDEVALDRALEGIEVVFHTAALVKFHPDLYELQMRVNVEGTRKLLAAMSRAGVRRLVYTSTVSVLGIPPVRSEPGDETTPFNWGRYRLGYNDSKRATEQLVLDATRSDPEGLWAVSVLPGTFFGPGDVNVNAGSYVRVIARSPIRFTPYGGTMVAHVDDVARGHLLALERGRRAERYILGGEPVSFGELFACIARELGRTSFGLTIPPTPLRWLGKAGSWLRDRSLPAPLTEGMTVAICSHLYYSSDKAIRELGWSYRPYAEAIRDQVAWMRERGLV